MATSVSLVDLKSLVNCAICLSDLKKPKSLACLHTFCASCLKGFVKQSTRRHSRKCIECPLCRDKTSLPERGVDGLKSNFYLEALIESVQVSEKSPFNFKGKKLDKDPEAALQVVKHKIKLLTNKLDRGEKELRQYVKRKDEVIRKIKDNKRISLKYVEEAFNEVEKRLRQEVTKATEENERKYTDGINSLKLHITKLQMKAEAIENRVLLTYGIDRPNSASHSDGPRMSISQEIKQLLDDIKKVESSKDSQVPTFESVLPSVPKFIPKHKPMTVKTEDLAVTTVGLIVPNFTRKVVRWDKLKAVHDVTVANEHPIYLAVGPELVYVSCLRGNAIEVYDRSCHIQFQDNGFPSPQGIAVIPGSNDVIICDRKEGVRQFVDDLTSYDLQYEDGCLSEPAGVACADDAFVVTDVGHDEVFLFWNRNDRAQTRIGSNGNGPAEFDYPWHIAYDSLNKRFIVSDTKNDRLQIFDMSGGLLHIFDGGNDTQLQSPGGIAVDPFGNIVVCDEGNHSIKVFDTNLNFLHEINENNGLDRPKDVALVSGKDGHMEMYVVDRGLNALIMFKDNDAK